MSSSDLTDKVHIRIEQHDVKMLDSLYRLDTRPVLEPCHVLAAHATAESVVHVLLDLFPGSIGQVAGVLVLFQHELGPDYEMYDALVQAIRPVIVENLEIGGAGKRRAFWFKCRPFEEIGLDVLEDGAVCLLKVVNVLAVAAEIGGNALEDVYTVGSWTRMSVVHMGLQAEYDLIKIRFVVASSMRSQRMI